MRIQQLVNNLLHRRTESEPSLADSLDNLDFAVQGLDSAVVKLTLAVEDLILIADRPFGSQGLITSAKDTVTDAVKMLDKMKYLQAPDESDLPGVKARNTQPSATNRITPLLPRLKGKNHDSV
jgi:hypothetical protein